MSDFDAVETTRFADANWVRLVRYLDGTLSPSEVGTVEAWLTTDARRAEAFARLRMEWEGAARTATHGFAQAQNAEWDVTTATRTIARRARQATHAKRSVLWRRVARLGVGTAAVAGLAMLLTGKPITQMLQSRTSLPQQTSQTFTSAAGQIAVVTLSDGTRATLGPATTLVATTGDAKAGIAVALTGQAMFTVNHASGTPFSVRTNSALTRVLGTTFLVRRYSSDRVTRVAVTDGRVTVSALHDTYLTATLSRQTLGEIDDSGHVVVTPNIATDDLTAWTSGTLVFRDTPVRDLIGELSRAYGVDIRLADSAFANRKLTLSIPITTLAVDDAVNLVGMLLDAHHIRAGAVITIAPGRPSSRATPTLRAFPSLEPSHGR